MNSVRSTVPLPGSFPGPPYACGNWRIQRRCAARHRFTARRAGDETARARHAACAPSHPTARRARSTRSWLANRRFHHTSTLPCREKPYRAGASRAEGCDEDAGLAKQQLDVHLAPRDETDVASRPAGFIEKGDPARALALGRREGREQARAVGAGGIDLGPGLLAFPAACGDQTDRQEQAEQWETRHRPLIRPPVTCHYAAATSPRR